MGMKHVVAVSVNMAEKTVELDQHRGELRINGFSTSDSDVVEYFEQRDEETLEHAVDTALRVGVLALDVADTSRDVDYVRRHFERLQQEFRTELYKHLGEDGQLEKFLESQFEGLRRELAVEAAEERGREEVVEQTRIKGLEFEDAIEAQLNEIAADAGDVLESTGNIDGYLGKKTGDFVYTLGDCQRSIVVEAKNRDSIQQPQIKREMEEALENRGSTYGIFVVRARSQMTNKVGTFTEFGRNFIVVGMSQTPEVEIEPELLRVAIKWARIRVIESHLSESASMDPSKISEHVTEAKRSIEQFKQIRSQCTSIEKSVSSIRERLSAIEDDIDEDLRAITAMVNASNH